MANCRETDSDPNVEHRTQMEVIKIKSTGQEKPLQKIKLGTLHSNELWLLLEIIPQNERVK